MSLLFLLSANPRGNRAALRSNCKVEAHSRKRLTATLIARLSLLLLLVLSSAGSVLAMPLDEYRSRIHQALDKLYELWGERENETVPEYAARASSAFDEVRKLVPLDETVEWDGGRVRVNNSWLEIGFQDYQQLPPSDSRRGDVLVRITERLSAIENRLDEIDPKKGNITNAATKDEEKARLEAILRRAEYSEKPPEKSLWERFWAWLASLFPSRSPLQPGQSSWLSLIAMILIFGLAACVIAYSVLKFLPFFKSRAERFKLEKRGPRVVLGERLAPEQTAADLLAEAESLARKGEIRAAIRKGYIALLCELGDRKVLTLAQHKTNHDYLRAVRQKRPLLNEMQKLTASFENHWYGSAPASPDDWTTFRSGYQKTLKTASLLSDK